MPRAGETLCLPGVLCAGVVYRLLCELPKLERRVRFPPPAPGTNLKTKNHTTHMKKSIVALIVGSMLAAGALFAAEGKEKAKAAGCCAKAAKEGGTCKHECCVAAAKEGNNCTKCKGSGPLAKPAAK